MGKAQYDANINEIKVVKNASSEASDRVREEIQTRESSNAFIR
jgi:hypothetical protein